MKILLILSLLLSISACQTAQTSNELIADDLSGQSPSRSGFSEQRLQRIAPAMQTYIDQGKLAGISTLVARKDEVVHWQVQGMQNKEASVPLSKESIFRIYSMTKPITAVAALTLWEQGKFHMHDPISKYFPELADMQVYVSGAGETMVLEKAKYPIRIIDLFMHTAGFSYGFTNSEVDKLYRATDMAKGLASRDTVLAELAKLPLNHQPGTAWHYGVNTDVIGFLVEKLSGEKLGEYMQEVIFDPLGMVDTGFSVPAGNASRLGQIYSVDQKTGQTIVMKDVPLGDYMSEPLVHNGGGGLVSTMSDYLKFAQMLLNEGELGGQRILGRKTVEYLTSNHLPKNLIPFGKDAPGEGYGLAMSVTVDSEQVGFMSSNGNYGWGGLASTYFRIDPEEELIIIGMAQFVPSGFHAYQNDLRNLVYQALVNE